MYKTGPEFGQKGGVRHRSKFSSGSSTYPAVMSEESAYVNESFWGEVPSLPLRLPVFISGDGHYIGSRVERESPNVDILERNVPLSPGNTPGNRSQDEELDAIHPGQPMDTIHGDDVWGPIATVSRLIPLFYGVQGLSTPDARFESDTTVSNRPLEPWVALQSDREEVDFVLNRRGTLYEFVAGTVDLSKSP